METRAPLGRASACANLTTRPLEQGDLQHRIAQAQLRRRCASGSATVLSLDFDTHRGTEGRRVFDPHRPYQQVADASAPLRPAGRAQSRGAYSSSPFDPRAPTKTRVRAVAVQPPGSHQAYSDSFVRWLQRRQSAGPREATCHSIPHPNQRLQRSHVSLTEKCV